MSGPIGYVWTFAGGIWFCLGVQTVSEWYHGRWPAKRKVKR